MRIGSLVAAGNGHGVGKLIALDGETATVEYLQSVAVRDRREVRVGALKPVSLFPETRCYLRAADGERWRAGRIGVYWEGQYEVLFPDREGGYFPESEIFVRCSRPIEDPTEVLIHRAQETMYFSEHRFPFVRSLVEQRSATRGLSGLFSSRIELFAHQVEVVRRVLEDPIQRYLLADEVGLGKTIEAGAILRQFLLDEAEGRALVLVPRLLKEQWTRELDDKFGAFDFEDRVTVQAMDEIGNVAGKPFRFVILNEAHHVAQLARSREPRSQSAWEAFRSLAHTADRLLLLSATPALHHEDAFLAMLHLLDPGVYRLDQLGEFRDRVQRRQDMGRFLLSFNEGASVFTLRRAVARLTDLIPNNGRLRNLTETLRHALDGEDAQARDQCVRRIRTHISEKYRLHRRLLRNRRTSVQEGLTAGRGGEGKDPVREYDLDVGPERLHNLLDDWRIGAAGAATETAADAPALRMIFLTFFELSGTWLRLFEEALRVRRGRAVTETLRSALSAEAISALQEAVRFPGEDMLIDAMLEVLAEPTEDGDRIDLLRMMLDSVRRTQAGQLTSKAVVFTSFSPVCVEIVARLRQVWGEQAVAIYGAGMSGEDVEREVRRFREEWQCSVLVCDRAGEEGRNLQFADWLIHFDLPFSPSRVEQRIGRLDRIGRMRTMRSRVFVGPEVENSLPEAWFAMLHDGFGVFRQSIASLQFFVDAKFPILSNAMFENGAQGLQDLLHPIQSEIEEEQIRISEQNALDEIDSLHNEAEAFYSQLCEFDATHDRLQKDTESWICDTLHFEKTVEADQPRIVTYRPRRTRGSTTLVPYDFVVSRMGRHLGRSGTYHRILAARTPGITLYRNGEAFVDTMARYVEWDDRGRASAVWRYDSNWSPAKGDEWTGFRFHYVVEADIAGAMRVLRESGLPGMAPDALRMPGGRVASAPV